MQKGLQDVAQYSALDEAGRRDHMHSYGAVFAITDLEHPAKKYHEETVKPLGNRKDGIERGVKAKVPPPSLMLIVLLPLFGNILDSALS